jgi:hypothetical protein
MLAPTPCMHGRTAPHYKQLLASPAVHIHCKPSIGLTILHENAVARHSRLQGCVFSICPATLDFCNWVAAPAGSLLSCMRRHPAKIPADAQKNRMKGPELMHNTIHHRSAVAWADDLLKGGPVGSGKHRAESAFSSPMQCKKGQTKSCMWPGTAGGAERENAYRRRYCSNGRPAAEE